MDHAGIEVVEQLKPAIVTTRATVRESEGFYVAEMGNTRRIFRSARLGNISWDAKMLPAFEARTRSSFILPTGYKFLQFPVQPLAEGDVGCKANADGNIPMFAGQGPGRGFGLRLRVHDHSFPPSYTKDTRRLFQFACRFRSNCLSGVDWQSARRGVLWCWIGWADEGILVRLIHRRLTLFESRACAYNPKSCRRPRNPWSRIILQNPA